MPKLLVSPTDVSTSAFTLLRKLSERCMRTVSPITAITNDPSVLVMRASSGPSAGSAVSSVPNATFTFPVSS